MGNPHKLTLEILSGPLDGASITLAAETEWTRAAGSPLSFPWDNDLGEPQARFVPVEGRWQLEPEKAKRGTHLLRPDVEDHLPADLQPGDILKASNTWLKVNNSAE